MYYRYKKNIVLVVILNLLIVLHSILLAYTHGELFPPSCIKGSRTYAGICNSYQAHMKNEEIPGTQSTDLIEVKNDKSCSSGKKGFYVSTCMAKVFGLSKYSYKLDNKDANCLCSISAWYECFEPYNDTGLIVDYECKYSKCID